MRQSVKVIVVANVYWRSLITRIATILVTFLRCPFIPLYMGLGIAVLLTGHYFHNFQNFSFIDNNGYVICFTFPAADRC